MKGRLDVDDFIAAEMQQIEAGGAVPAKNGMRPSGIGSTAFKSVSTKPTFGISASKKPGGAFAKPGFAMMGGAKKTEGAPVISKANFNPTGAPPAMGLGRRRKQDDDFIDNELA